MYLVKHPEAKDSLAGVRNWWLEEPDHCSEEDVRRAAEALVELGMLSTWESSSGSVIFSPTREFLRAPHAFVEGLTRGAERKH